MNQTLRWTGRITLIVTVALVTSEAAFGQQDQSPDILLIMPDQMRGDCLSVLDHPTVRTPCFDELARQGTLFRRAYSQSQAFHALVDNRIKYIWRPEGGEELLFDLEADPQEEHDLAREPARRSLLDQWRKRLIQRLADRPEGFSDRRQLIAGRPYPPLQAGAPREATATAVEFDLDATWVETPWGTPVIDRGEPGQWDHVAVDNPYVHVEDGVYYCFYEGQDKPPAEDWHEQTGLAISRDGVHWSKHAGNPILQAGPDGAWDSKAAKLPAGLIKHQGTYHLFYSGRRGGSKAIGLATASDLTGPWTKQADNPIFTGRPAAWDRHLSTHPAAMFQRDDQFLLLYRGMLDFYSQQGLGLITSRDLITWQRHADSDEQPLVSADHEIASLGVARVGSRFIGLAQQMQPQRHYWLSDDLIRWERGPVVRFRTSVAAETLSSPFLSDGRWTVLYEQQDRIYRAVLGAAESSGSAQDAATPVK